jgi:raffinose/stachyose/melibiose transport system substrate-binding protein
MELMGQWAPAVQRDESDSGEGLGEDLGIFTFPLVEGGAGSATDALGGGGGYAVGSNASPEAIDFVRYLSSPENQALLAKDGITVPPAIESAASEISDPLLQDVSSMLSQADYLQLYYDQYLPPAVAATLADSIQELFAGTATPEEVAQAFEDAYAAEVG